MRRKSFILHPWSIVSDRLLAIQCSQKPVSLLTFEMYISTWMTHGWISCESRMLKTGRSHCVLYVTPITHVDTTDSSGKYALPPLSVPALVGRPKSPGKLTQLSNKNARWFAFTWCERILLCWSTFIENRSSILMTMWYIIGPWNSWAFTPLHFWK